LTKPFLKFYIWVVLAWRFPCI